MELKKQIQLWKDIKRNNYNCISLNHFLANSIGNIFMIENIFFPILVKNELMQFTNVVLENSNGDSFYLVLINGKYQFFKIGFEPDCDGAYYYAHNVDFLEVVKYINEYKVSECYTKGLLNDLNKL